MARNWRDPDEVEPFAPLTRAIFNRMAGNTEALYQEAQISSRRWIPTAAIAPSGTSYEYNDNFAAALDLDWPSTVILSLTGTIISPAGSGVLFMQPNIDGVNQANGSGYRIAAGNNVEVPLQVTAFFPEVSRGKHIFSLYWRASSASFIPQFGTTRYINLSVWEVRV